MSSTTALAPERPDVRIRGFWPVAYAFGVMMAFSAVPTPLYVLYQQRDGFGPFTVTVVFATYAVGVVLSVFTVGHVSDWIGRRRVLIWALLTNMLAGLIFLLPGLGSLLVARFVSGVSVGMLTATATAYLMELHLTGRPGTGRRRADLVATAANIGGIGLGPLISGLLAEYVPFPLTVPYLVFHALLGIGLVVVLRAHETVTRRDVRWRPQRVSVPAGARARYAAAGAAAFASFAVFGLFTSLTPGFLAGVLGQPSHAVAGQVTFLAFGAGVAGQLVMTRVSLARQLYVGLAGLVAGLAALILGIWLPHFGLFLVGGLLTGAGAGTVFKGAVVTTAGLAAPRARGEALAGLFLVGYVGLAVPVLGLGFAAQHLSTRTAVLIFAAGLASLLVAAARPLVRR
ncbi:MFS transporter [Micromonospora sp. WMMD1082]|uniref:MFS transporter n=1 Tax=Micromonospora sp. WMMD1082 TaxID=3016104 RepID=UPI00241636F3|nr:MFS transporter [Micromonospora sp. WMMD1082]MDG4795718.1 MFS transporter [Micromonospora sp. WMMD1082]